MAIVQDLTRRVVTTAQLPLRVIEQAAGGANDGEDLEQRLDQLQRRLRDEVSAAAREGAATSSQQAVAPLAKRLGKLERTLAQVAGDLGQLREDVEHIRTEQAAARARSE